MDFMYSYLIISHFRSNKSTVVDKFYIISVYEPEI